ncbi:MAG: hypothetical protein WCH59_05200 [Chitinophagia bacterium]|jgi:hypothetical protein|nr:hypothetical protein [Chitinophagia bacterium]
MISDISILPTLTPEMLEQEVNKMIEHNFEGLIQILYRLDVSEQKLKEVLAANQQEDAGKLITAVILERLVQREKTRKSFTINPDIPEEDKW